MKSIIVAEIGQNHVGDMSLAEHLIELAKDAGADMVKFQLYDHRLLYGNQAPNIALTFYQAERLFDYGKKYDTEVFFSVFDTKRVLWCEVIGVNRYKVAWSQRNNRKLIEAIENTNKPYIVSVSPDGECAWQDYKPLRLLCVPEYPAHNVQLPEKFNGWGYSDHTIGIETAKEALKLGAVMIEKHFCLNHQLGVDAPWSASPAEVKELNRCK